MQLNLPYFGIKSQIFSFFIVGLGYYLSTKIIINFRQYQATYLIIFLRLKSFLEKTLLDAIRNHHIIG